ncbi:MAG: hypothetical protein RR888_01800 [Akkermansia sp.]
MDGWMDGGMEEWRDGGMEAGGERVALRTVIFGQNLTRLDAYSVINKKSGYLLRYPDLLLLLLLMMMMMMMESTFIVDL